MSLSSLPNELLFDSVSYLSISSLNALSQTNRDLNHVLTPILFARALNPEISQSVLSLAVKFNSLPITKHLLANDVFVTTVDELCNDRCCSPLQVAAANGFVSLVKAFIKHDPALNVQAHEVRRRSSGKSTPMMLAAANGHTNVARVFTDEYAAFEWEKHPALVECDMDFYRPLRSAVKNFQDPVVRFLFHHLHPDDWPRILPFAASAGLCELVTELLPRLHYRKESAAYALGLAARKGHLRCVEELVEYADQTDLKLALRGAARGGHDGVVVYLLELFDDKAAASTGALYDAAVGGSRDVLNLLLAYGCDVNASLKIPGWNMEATILHWIARMAGRQVGLDRICAMLLEAGADCNTRHKYLDKPYRMMKSYPPNKSSPSYSDFSCTYGRVKKAFLGGRTYDPFHKCIDGRVTRGTGVWYEHDYVRLLAEEVDTQFVEAPRWF